MAIYINVKSKLDKVIRVDTDNYDEAIQKARDEFSNLGLSADWVNKRNVSFEENKTIIPMSELLAELSSKSLDFNEEELMMLVSAFSKDDTTAKYVFEETINILKEKYHYDIQKIDI